MSEDLITHSRKNAVVFYTVWLKFTGEKAGVLLGRSSGFEKSVKEMYRFRSLFIHGKAPLPGAFFTSHAIPEYGRHSHDATEASFLAAAVLVASLQQIAKRNWKSLSFSFTIDVPKDNPEIGTPNPT